MEITRLGREGGEIDELIAQAEDVVTRVTAQSAPDDFASLADGLDALTKEIEEAIESEQPRVGLLTGYRDLDDILTGLHPGQLILCAARPSMGKSALAQNIAENIADRGVSAALASLEMSLEEVQLRALARACRIPSSKLKTGQLPVSEITTLREGREKVRARAPFFFVEDSPSITIPQLRARAKRLKRQNNLGLIVIDYLQLMVGSGREDNRQAEIAQISRALKVLARELNLPVLALSQLNRNLESRTDKRPMLSDLRDSGALEQDADVVLFVYRDDYYNPLSESAGLAEIIVAKNRNGETQKTVKLTFSRLYTEFRSVSQLKEVA
jgi:replicative DNA helicase